MKPLIRWTVGGNPPLEGLECLRLSILFWRKIYGHSHDYLICHNNIDEFSLKKFSIGVDLYRQSWADCPLPIKGGGSMWKYCPPRLAPDRHEVIIDNDLLIYKRINKIDEFLTGDRVMMCQDSFKAQGKFTLLFGLRERFNAGLIGLPPHYDIASLMLREWIINGRHDPMGDLDEQGLITYILKNSNPLVIPLSELAIIHPWGFCRNADYDPVRNINIPNPIQFSYSDFKGAHFVRLNHDFHYSYYKFLGDRLL